MENKYKISAFMITRNEEKVIGRAMESLTWADEIILADDAGTTDRTREIARKFTDKIYDCPRGRYSDFRNFALSKCQYDWVFFLDADEVCSPELIAWFKTFQEGGQEAVASLVDPSTSQLPWGGSKTSRVDMYEVRRLEHFRGRLHRFGECNPSYQWRFFRKQGTVFVGDLHEYATFDGEVRRLEKPILHLPDENLTGYMAKVNRYSSMDAERLFSEGVKRGPAYMFFSGLTMFYKAYIRKQGFRDGLLGFILAVFSGTGFFLRQAKLYMKNLEARKN